jgi:chromosome segregation ATPase
MQLGKVGSLQNVPAPSAAVLNEALKLLATFGDSKSISALLEQVREVQANNEQVFRDTQEALSALRTTQSALEDAKQEFATSSLQENAALQRRSDELSKAEAQLSGRLAKFAQDQSAANKRLNEAEGSVSMAEKAVGAREAACADKESKLAELEASLKRTDTELTLRKEQLQVREKKLRAALDGG